MSNEAEAVQEREESLVMSSEQQWLKARKEFKSIQTQEHEDCIMQYILLLFEDNEIVCTLPACYKEQGRVR
jgi:hypothetical protein